MGWFDTVLKIAPTVIAAGATLYGAKMESDAKKEAANTLSTASSEATDAELAAIAKAEETMLRQQEAASPGLLATQAIIGRGDQLTDEQKRGIADVRKTTLDALQGGSLRGSAGATVAAVRDAEAKTREQYLTANQQRADQAASNLSGQWFNAGNNQANLNLKSGDSVSSGLMDTGNINASSQLGQASTTGQAIGDIGAIIADSLKQEAKKSSYEKIGKTNSDGGIA